MCVCAHVGHITIIKPIKKIKKESVRGQEGRKKVAEQLTPGGRRVKLKNIPQ